LGKLLRLQKCLTAMQRIFYLLIYFLVSAHVFAQNIEFVNYHINDHNKKDLNQAYVNAQTTKINTLDDNLFADGMIVRNGDTLTCKIYLPKHKINNDSYLYIVAKLPDSSYIFTPKDISGYTVNGISMRAHRSVMSSDTSYFFIKLIAQGYVTLYSRIEVPSDEEYTYYFNKRGDKDLYFLAPNKVSDFYMPEAYDKDSPMLSKYSSNNENKFKAVFAAYLKDCETVSSKIASKFYTIADVETIIKEYNACKK
jgi:hypothetical protein